MQDYELLMRVLSCYKIAVDWIARVLSFLVAFVLVIIAIPLELYDVWRLKRGK